MARVTRTATATKQDKPQPPKDEDIKQASGQAGQPAEAEKQTRVPPIEISKTIDTREFGETEEGKTVFDDDGERVDDIPEIDVENNLDNLEAKARHLKFLEEELTITIAEATDKNQERYVFCAINGKGPGPNGTPWLPRNTPIKIARKYVQMLAQSRPVRYRNNDYLDPTTGEHKSEQVASSAPRYPFTVVHDPNPEGHAWLARILSQGVRR